MQATPSQVFTIYFHATHFCLSNVNAHNPYSFSHIEDARGQLVGPSNVKKAIEFLTILTETLSTGDAN